MDTQEFIRAFELADQDKSGVSTPLQLYKSRSTLFREKFKTLVNSPCYVQRVLAKQGAALFLDATLYYDDKETLNLLNSDRYSFFSFADYLQFCRWAVRNRKSLIKTVLFLFQIHSQVSRSRCLRRHDYTYVIVAPNYDENAGGTIVLHKLCDMLYSCGQKAFLFPIGLCYGTWMQKVRFHFFHFLGRNPYLTNPDWKTPFSVFLFSRRKIFVYPEIIPGNPLGARNVVRLFMHNPGHFKGKTDYGEGEMYFRYSNSFAKGFVPPRYSIISPHFLTISATPECYNLNGAAEVRRGSAFLIRKGKGKPILHDLQDSIMIDGLRHEEISQIFKRVETFISYDPITAYSKYAVLCGCRSVVIFSENESVEQYYPSPERRSGLCFGMEDYSGFSEDERRKVVADVEIEKEIAKANVLAFVAETRDYFSCIRRLLCKGNRKELFL